MDIKTKLILIAVFVGIVGWVIPIEDTDNVFEIVVNNTNKAPTSHVPGTNERIGDNTTYWNNDTPIQILVWAHANTTGATAEIHLYINGTKVADTSGRPIGSAEESNKTIVAIIPRWSYYSIEVANAHHYEWREYPILSGRNGTVSINQTIITNGTSDHANLTNLNWSSAGHVLDSILNFTIEEGYIYNDNQNCYVLLIGNGTNKSEITCINEDGFIYSTFEVYHEILNFLVSNSYTGFTSLINQIPEAINIEVTNLTGGNFMGMNIYEDEIKFSKDGTEKMAVNQSGDISISTDLDMQNNTILNYKPINFTSYRNITIIRDESAGYYTTFRENYDSSNPFYMYVNNVGYLLGTKKLNFNYPIDSPVAYMGGYYGTCITSANSFQPVESNCKIKVMGAVPLNGSTVGNVGINVSAPSEKLSIGGNVSSTSLSGTGIAAVCVYANGTLYRSTNVSSSYTTC